METRDTKREIRAVATNFETREENNNPVIEGYFSVFNQDYVIADGLSESIAPTAFDNTLGNDIRALTNHDTTLVLGRTTNNTLSLRTDSHGLWGKITLNPKDSDAMNLMERVKRGDVNQCSFGFEIVDEESEVRSDNSIHWTIKAVNLFEVSVCTIPAYTGTSVSVRTAQADEIRKRQEQAWKENLLKKLRGEN